MDLFKSTGGNRYLLLCTGIFNSISFYRVAASVTKRSATKHCIRYILLMKSCCIYYCNGRFFVFIRWIAFFDVIILSGFTFEMQEYVKTEHTLHVDFMHATASAIKHTFKYTSLSSLCLLQRLNLTSTFFRPHK